MTKTTMLTEKQARLAFAHYFLDLKAENARDGAHVSKATEWEGFIAHSIAEQRVPASAKAWKCPRSLEAEIRAADPRPTGRGGPGRGQGRKAEHASGPLERKNVTLDAQTIEAMRALGGNDLSAGIRRAAALLREHRLIAN